MVKFKNASVAAKYEPVYSTDVIVDFTGSCDCNYKGPLSGIDLQQADLLFEQNSNLLKLKPVAKQSKTKEEE